MPWPQPGNARPWGALLQEPLTECVCAVYWLMGCMVPIIGPDRVGSKRDVYKKLRVKAGVGAGVQHAGVQGSRAGEPQK